MATHLDHLAAGLAAAGLDVRLLATNVPADAPRAWLDSTAPYPRYRMYLPGARGAWLRPDVVSTAGVARLVRYAWRVARRPADFPGSRSAALASLLWYRRFIAEIRPRIVHVQHPMERHLYARLVREWEGLPLPLVVTLHSFFDEHADDVIRGLMASNLRHADRLIAVSPTIAEQAVSLGADPDRISVIRSGVDVERFRPRNRPAARERLGVSPAIPLVLFVGNLEPRKALDRALLALSRVRGELPGVTFAVVGSGRSVGVHDQEPTLRRMVADLSLGECVRFVGDVSATALLDWYAAADVFVLPSTSEAQGIVALEAMASGLPVVVSAVGGLRETVRDGETGFLVPVGDVDLLAARLMALLGDAPLRERVGRCARASVSRDFSWERAVKATMEVYREVLDV